MNRSRPLITLGIPTYNRPTGLANTLKQATQQTYENLEILVSDNASLDERAVRAVVESYLVDARVRYIRHPENIGSLGNFPFLTREAKGEYFCWLADDDHIELDYVESLMTRLDQSPRATIIMGGYDVEDTISEPVLHLNLTPHLKKLAGPTAYSRIKSYLLQPDYLGKSRLNWGLFPTTVVRRAFEECASYVPVGKPPMWADFPIDLRMLSYGDVAIEERVIWHVRLLASSDGRSTLSNQFGKLMETSRRTEASLTRVVEDADLTADQKAELRRIIHLKAIREKVELFVYYKVIGQSPALARQVKKLWYALFA